MINAKEQQAEEHRIQRRFMWQEMNNSLMGGLMGRMFNNARAMLGERFLPSTVGYAKTMLDFMPTETTRVKYVIRNPHTNKPMKIIKMRSPKKVVKLRMVGKPAVTESIPLTYEQRIRQLEKEQEMIVEGKLPATSDEAIMEKYFKKKVKSGTNNDIVTGKIMEYQTWKPVYKPGEKPTSFVTVRPQALSHLHTDISSKDHELLPKPEKLVGHHEYVKEDDDVDVIDGDQVENELAKQMGHRYEVTEHTGEESGEIHSVSSMESGFIPIDGYRRTHTVTTSNSPTSSRSTVKSRGRQSKGTSSTTTTEAPNYPPAFLKKFREREAAANKPTKKSPHKYSKEVVIEEEMVSTQQTPSFGMSSLRARLQEQQRRQKQQQKEQLEEEELEAALMDAMQGEKWPTEVQHSSYQLSSPIGPSAVAFEQSFGGKTSASTIKSEYKRPQRGSIRERGSVKFSDKPNYDDLA
ncbi:uncharacterized protein [Drosophila tropicalis]|uniref:uncharacterized protein n=1 Tax=Drosophila tropicalis TaxID=46794 RepID=UPI0035ABC9E0